MSLFSCSIDECVLEKISCQMESLSDLSPSPNPSHLTEALQLVLMVYKQMPSSDLVASMTPEVFLLMKNITLKVVGLIESCLQQKLPDMSIMLEGRWREKQLQLLSLLANVLVSLLMVEEEEEIEVCRDSVSFNGEGLLPACTPRSSLASHCLPILQHSKSIVDKVCVCI